MASGMRRHLQYGLAGIVEGRAVREDGACTAGEFLEALAAGGGEALEGPPRWDEERRAALLILHDPACAFEVVVAAAEILWPARAAWALVELLPGDERHPAEAALEHLGRPSRPWLPLRLRLSLRPPAELELAEACALLHATLLQAWTPARREAVRAYRRLGRQADVARELGVTQQAVSQMLQGARFRELREVEERLGRWLAGRPAAGPGFWPLGRRVAAQTLQNA